MAPEAAAALDPCRSPWWARGGHAQTLAGHWLPSAAASLPWQDQRIELEDGDVLHLRLALGEGRRVVCLFHGLGGSASRDYVLRAAAHFHQAGWSVVAANHRGAGEGRGLARRPTHSGATGDLAAVLRAARRRFPGQGLLAVGYSLSGSILLLLLGRDAAAAGDGLPDAAIAVNPPVDLERASLRLARGLGRLYDLRFVRLLRAELQARADAGLLERVPPLPALATLRDFDERYTAPATGFRDRADYYARCACGPHLATIGRPTVILTAADDPIAPAADVQVQACAPVVHVHAERHGGHLGYLTRDRPNRRWLEPALLHFAERLEAGLSAGTG